MSPDPRSLHIVLCAIPLRDRLAALMCSIVERDPRAVTAVASVVSAAVVMAEHLDRHQRTVIADHMRREAEALIATTWN
jgi:hypothetical protein